MPKLTKRFIDTLQPDPNGRDIFTWDSELTALIHDGFDLRLAGVA